MSQFTISGIRRIAVINTDALQPGLTQQDPDQPATISAYAHPFPKFGESSFITEKKPHSQHETTLNFKSLRQLDPDYPAAFIIEDNNREKWLIGAYEPPFPKIEATFDTGSDIAGQRAIQYKIQWPFQPIRCTAWIQSDTTMPNR